MNQVFSFAGFRALRVAWALLAISIVAMVVLGISSRWFLEHERGDSLFADRKFREAQARVEGAKRERDDLAASVVVFSDLVERGILQEQRRLDFVERLEQLRSQYHLAALEYEISPQRPLILAGSRVFNTVDVMASRVQLKMRALHEGDLLGFVNAVDRPVKGFQHIERCEIRRLETVAIDIPGPRVEGECLLDWISIKEKGGSRAR
jgi:hypothetical protein